MLRYAAGAVPLSLYLVERLQGIQTDFAWYIFDPSNLRRNLSWEAVLNETDWSIILEIIAPRKLTFWVKLRREGGNVLVQKSPRLLGC